ncbi:Uncharacterised protein [uncultured archaeon]|nr:Uncharacterised protein [uncultured archaeon]
MANEKKDGPEEKYPELWEILKKKGYVGKINSNQYANQKPTEAVLIEKQPQRGPDTLVILDPALANEFFVRRVSAYLRKLIGEFQKTPGRTIPMHRAYALASPIFRREEAYDVLKALRDKKILDFSLQDGVKIIDVNFTLDTKRR